MKLLRQVLSEWMSESGEVNDRTMHCIVVVLSVYASLQVVLVLSKNQSLIVDVDLR